MTKMCRRLWCALVVLFIPLAAQAQRARAPETYIARAGRVYISEDEFVERFELLPGFGRHRKSQLEGSKLAFLYSLIAEKLLAQKAQAWGMASDSLLEWAMNETTKLLARDELYREEILRRVSVSPQEIDEGISCAQVELLVEYIYFGRGADAGFVRSLIKSADDFHRLWIDSSYHAQRDTVTVVWGEADPGIEKAAYRLRRNEISPVITAGNGFYILRVKSARPNSFYLGMTPDVLRERVSTALRRRNERARLDEYIAEVLKDKIGFARPGPMGMLADALTAAYRDDDRDSLMFLTPTRVQEVRRRCAGALRDTIAVAGTTSISVGEVLGRLVGKSFEVRRDALSSIPYRLNVEVKVIVQQELLAQEALRRHLDAAPEVRRAIEMWRESYLAVAVRDSLRRTVRVSDAETWAVMKYRDTSVVVPQVQIRELKTNTMLEMQAALDDIDHGASLEEAVRKWSSDSAAKANGGMSGFFAVTERLPVGAIAGALEFGQRYGPLAAEGGQVYFEVLAKKSDSLQQDTAFSGRFARARQDAYAMKARRALTLFLAGAGKEMGFDVYADRLRMLQVSPIPMMTFRILGFGGKMPAVPFVDPQLDWLDVETPKEVVP
jgi:parvulin-like peptidyl-prolyl isomerase